MFTCGIFLLVSLGLLYTSFSARTPIYRFNRNIFAARMISFVFFFTLILVSAVNLIGYLDQRETLIHVLAPFLSAVIIVVLTFIEYQIHGEGIYEEGVIVKGIFQPWKKITDSKIVGMAGTGKSHWTIYSDSPVYKTKTITVTNEVAKNIDHYFKEGNLK